MSLRISLEPLAERELDWVVATEATLHLHPWTRGNFQDSLNSGYSCWLLREGEHRIGYVVVMRVLDEAHLLNISVAREFQGSGYGTQALQALFEVLPEHGVNCLLLEVRPSNDAALALYRKLGFGEIGRRRNYYPAQVGREDALVMRRALS